MDLVVTNLSETQELGRKLAYCCSSLKDSCVIYLIGDLGVGKTTFVKYLINQFQIKKNIQPTEVTSPTFNLLNEYEVNDLIIKELEKKKKDVEKKTK